MKSRCLNFGALLILTSILCGCGDSKTPPSETERKPIPGPSAAPAAPAAAPAAPAAAPAVAEKTPVAPPSAAPVEQAKTETADATSQFVGAAKAQGDSLLGQIGGDLVDKVKTLAQSAAGNETLKSQLTNSLQSLATGNDSAGLASLYQAAQGAGLTPSQIQLAKDVGNVASAYVVQKNFASLEGAQSDVATIVNSLRQGQVTPAIPAIQKVAQNASLTSTQKQLLASIADKYAPGVSKAASTLQQGLQSIPGLGGGK